MPKAKVRQAKPKARKAARRASAPEARLATLEARFAEWGPKLDAPFEELIKRVEALEQRAPVPGPKEMRDHRGRTETRATLDRRGRRERKVSPVQWVLQEQKETRAILVRRVCPGQKVKGVTQDRRADLDPKARRAIPVQPVLQEQKGTRATQDRRGLRTQGRKR